MKKVFLALGGNMGDREANLQEAIGRLHGKDLEVTRVSRVYETEPMGLRAQPWFLNLVLEANTSLFPRQLLSRVQHIEREMGRVRRQKNGPRTIDIDVLFYERFVIETPDLVVPHPRLQERRFVLQPLADLAPDWRHPVTKRSVREMLGALSGQSVKQVDFQPRIPGEGRTE